MLHTAQQFPKPRVVFNQQTSKAATNDSKKLQNLLSGVIEPPATVNQGKIQSQLRFMRLF